MRLILWDIFWIVHIPFVHMVKFKLLTQFLVDHLAHPFVSSLILFFFSHLLLSLIMRLIIFFLSPHNLHLLFCCVLLSLLFNFQSSLGTTWPCKRSVIIIGLLVVSYFFSLSFITPFIYSLFAY